MDQMSTTMQVSQVRPGLWRWTAPHPDWRPADGGPGGWPPMVGCTYYEAADATILFDPLAPPEGTTDAARFWRALDGDMARRELPVVVFLGNDWHERSAGEVLARYLPRLGGAGASIWAQAAAAGQIGSALSAVVAEGAALPGGVRAFEVRGGPSASEVVYYLPDQRAAIFADALIGAGERRARVAPASWADATPAAQASYHREFRASLRRLLALPLDLLLTSHGPPVLADGHRALAEALAAPAWGDEAAWGVVTE
jgi:glyoxylase-like metal-dependent hydrolase (beta-lactamase superfamily II)